MIPSTAEIRQFLMEAFSDDDLNAFCFDYFADVYNGFTVGQTKGQRIQLLMEYCQRRNAMQNLIAALQRARPEQAAKWSALSEPPPAGVMRERNPKRIFISHAHQDTKFAHKLSDDLQARGWKTWIVPESILPGEKWVEAIQRGLDESGVFVSVLTSYAVQSRWVTTEMNTAIALEHEGAIRLIPLEAGRCEIPSLWKSYQRISFIDNYVNGLRDLLVDIDPAGSWRQDEQIPTPEIETIFSRSAFKGVFHNLTLIPPAYFGAAVISILALVSLLYFTGTQFETTPTATQRATSIAGAHIIQTLTSTPLSPSSTAHPTSTSTATPYPSTATSTATSTAISTQVAKIINKDYLLQAAPSIASMALYRLHSGDQVNVLAFAYDGGGGQWLYVETAGEQQLLGWLRYKSDYFTAINTGTLPIISNGTLMPVSISTPTRTISPTPECPKGLFWDLAVNRCRQAPTSTPTRTISPTPECPKGQFWDLAVNRCRQAPTSTTIAITATPDCGAGRIWNPVFGRCESSSVATQVP